MSTINRVAHGLTAGQRVSFSAISPAGTGLDPDVIYFVVSAGLAADTFQVSETVEGTPLTLALAVTSASMTVVPETTDTDPGLTSYTAITDPAVAMAPPTPPPTPTAPTVTSALVSGIVRLQIALNDTAEAKVRAWEVQVTHKFIAANPDWTTPTKLTLPEGSVTVSLPALGSTIYNVRVSSTDVYGTQSGFSAVTSHTTLAGADALSAALAGIATDVADGIITETKIADGAISTPKLQAGSVTAQVLAATIVLASLIKTADTGRRIEIDIDGIRLYDAAEALLVRIPTNGDPVYVNGTVDAGTLTVQTAAALRGAVSLEGNAVMTLQNGVATPSVAPTLVASVDSLTLTSSPSNAKPGIGYDTAAGTFWTACDPTIAPYYVAQEWNATTGALVRSLPATGSLTTVTTTLGSTSHVSDTADGLVGTTDSHITTPLTIPAGLSNVKITKVAVWMAGRLGSCVTRNGVWDTSNVNLRESASYTAASGGATTVGASALHNQTLSSPLSVTAGTTYRCGFRRVNSTDGSQHDKDDGGGKTTYSGDGTTANGTGWGTRSTASKPNVYITYTYDVDTRQETAPMIAVCTDGTYIYTLDTLGQVWQYDRTLLTLIATSFVQTGITGTKTQAGMFYDATANELIITTTSGTGAGVFPKFVRVNPSSLATSVLFYTASAGPTFNGTTDTLRGGARLADPLNASAATYWVPITGTVYAYTFSGSAATNTANREFGTVATVVSGITYDGTQFRGFSTTTPTKIWKFSAWDWTTASAVYWMGYSWYDSNVTGGTHETACSPRTSITMRRREQVTFQNPPIPSGGTDDPDNRRVYMLPGASDFAPGAAWLQATGNFTSRIFTNYTGSGTHDGAGTAFPSGTAAQIKSSGVGWTLKGNGFINKTGTSFPVSPVTGDIYWRSDLNMEFFYNGTRWLSTQVFIAQDRIGATAGGTIPYVATTVAGNTRISVSANGYSDVWLERVVSRFFIGGGTALSASHMWVGTFAKQPAGTNVATVTINSGGLNAWRELSVAIGALLAVTEFDIDLLWTKTGTPGSLFVLSDLHYRYVAA